MKRHFSKRNLADSIVTHIVLIAVCFIFFFPVLWIIMSSFSKSGSIYDIHGFFPDELSMASYVKLFTDTTMYDYPNWLKNTLYVAVFSSLIGTILVILTAYTISRFRFKSRKMLMKSTLVLSMFPSFMGMTAVYLIMVNFDLINQLWSLILIYAAGAPMGYLVKKGYFDTITNTIYESVLNVVLGQTLSQGGAIGQINDLSAYKVTAMVDEHYIDRVVTGLTASFMRQDKGYDMLLKKVYPEVREGRFKIDLTFNSELPDNIRTGQTYNLNLQLGQPVEAVYIPRGAFFQKTGGRWIYVVDEVSGKAYRREIRIGRQNPRFYEVLDGLSKGEKVITSSYDNFGDNEVLILKEGK